MTVRAKSPAAGKATDRRGRRTTIDLVGGEGSSGQLLHDALDGDRDAWNQIVDDNSRLLWWIARSYRLDDATAADVVQTVWLQLLRAGHRIRNPERLSAWLATVARRESLNRVSGREIPSEMSEHQPDRTAPSVEDRVVDDETIGLVLAAFAKLSPQDQQLLRLVCDVPPKSYEEVAALLGRSTGYIGPTRQRAVHRLRGLIHEMGLT